ncbi:restriction endonuclease subunit S [uncultured Alistipes sp.]|uniref:restriction endonuclease subunit S n=1 Tax=uncultured Alistipes sp. TaxID=538949 RepID=UPI002582E91C|nr:restriction endonuclease subunit S [uncultured Alistipes sp.]
MATNTDIPQGYKATALGIIPQEWEVKTLGNIAEINPSKGKITSKVVTFLAMSDISEQGGVINENILPIDSIKPGLTPFRKGDVIIAKITPCFENGKGALLDKITEDDGFGSTEFHVIRCQQDNKFVYYHTQSYAFRKRLESQMTGSAGQKRVPADSVAAYKIAVPPLAEQRKIAEVLGVWDEAIEKQARLIEKLALRKRGLMQRLLSAKLRLPGFSEPWKIHKLQELFTERNETNRTDLPLLSITGDRGVILQTESEKRDTSNDDKSKYKRIAKGDIGYNTMRMWQGRSALSGLEGIVSPAYTIVVPNTDVDGYYMSVLFKQPRLIYDFWTHSQGLVGDTLNCKYRDFGQVHICCPPLAEQKAITEVLTAADREIELAKEKLERLRRQKRGLMQQLLSGKKRVKINI